MSINIGHFGSFRNRLQGREWLERQLRAHMSGFSGDECGITCMRDPEYCDERRLERRLADVLVVPGIQNIKFETWAQL
jgi:hypothetical protein